MRISQQVSLLFLAALTLCQVPLCAQEQPPISEKSSSSSSSSSSGNSSSMSSTSNSEKVIPNVGGSSSSTTGFFSKAKDNSNRPPDTGVFSIPTEKTSISFVPKFKQRINDLGDQIRLVQAKAFITADEASKFLERDAKLLVQESELSKKGFPRAELDDLEKAITLLNADLFKAMRKNDQVKAGPAEKEVNDPNLIPAYPDPELQPNSGNLSGTKK